jgi:hypothetical protein
VGEGLDLRAGSDVGVADHAVGADAHAIAQADAAFEDAVDVDLDLAAAQQLAAHVQPRRVGQAHAGLHQRLGAGALEAALQVGQLHGAVDTQHFGLVVGLGGHHRHAFGHGHGDDIGQVVLALRVVVLQGPTQRFSAAVGAAIMPV